jgi:hypothetical protein
MQGHLPVVDYRSPTTRKLTRTRFNSEWAAGFITGLVAGVLVAGLLLATFLLCIRLSGD